MSPELQPIANRAADGDFLMPADNLIQIVPLGEFEHSGSGLTQVLDRVGIETMAAQFGNDGGERLVDFDHESLNSDRRTTAAGWLQSVQARADGLWGLIRWSKSGLDAVRGGDYKFISPVFLPSECESLGNSRVRPLRLESAGLTNRPNLKIAALTNRAEETVPQQDAVDAWNNLVRKTQGERKIRFEAAWSLSKTTHPQIFGAYLAANHPKTPIPNRSNDDPRPSLTTTGDPVAIWENAVKRIQAQEGVSFERAFDRAKIQHPRHFVQYQQEYDRQMRERDRHTL